MKKLIVLWTALLLLTVGLRATPANADHDSVMRQVADESEALKCLTDELRGGLRRQFHHSSVYQEIMSVNNEINSAARSIRNSARSGSDTGRLPQDVEYLTEHVYELAGLVREAKHRSNRGFDQPIVGCTDQIDVMISGMAAKADFLARLIGSSRGMSGRPTYPGSGYGGYGGTGYGTQGYGPTNYGGTYYRGNNAPSHGSNKLMDPRLITSNQYQNGNGQVGIYGANGRGVEFNNGGVVLKLGGAQIRLK